jgi:hypothetical protein
VISRNRRIHAEGIINGGVPQRFELVQTTDWDSSFYQIRRQFTGGFIPMRGKNHSCQLPAGGMLRCAWPMLQSSPESHRETN